MRVLTALLLFLSSLAFAEDPEAKRITELDAYWAEVSRAVKEGDFEGYKATCHAEGVLVSGSRENSTDLADALARWKKEFDATRDGKMKASVEFRFATRIGNETTAHETGMFLYTSEPAEGKKNAEHIHFEALLVKRGEKWKILMEYQKSKGTPEEWAALAPKK